MNRDAAVALDRRVVVCVGTGGVGKTTVAASIALEAALRGQRVVVLTIDPAPRLADALGLATLDSNLHAVPLTRDDSQSEARGELFALRLDTKRGFDALVERLATDEVREELFENRLYEHLSTALAGSAEYAAMDRVLTLVDREDLDLIVVDTPPSQHALDFLDAPGRLLALLDSRFVRLWLQPAMAAGRFGLRLFQRGVQGGLQLLEKVTGLAFLEEITEFLMLIETLANGLRSRGHEVQHLLQSDAAGFVLVCGPGEESTAAAQEFLVHLDEREVPVVGIVANRVRTWPTGDAVPPVLLEAPDSPDFRALHAALAGALDALDPEHTTPGATDAEATEALAAASRYASLVQFDEQGLASLRRCAREQHRFYCTVSEFPSDVHDTEGLHRVRAALFPKLPARPTSPGDASPGDSR